MLPDPWNCFIHQRRSGVPHSNPSKGVKGEASKSYDFPICLSSTFSSDIAPRTTPHLPKRKVAFRTSIFRFYVWFREGIDIDVLWNWGKENVLENERENVMNIFFLKRLASSTRCMAFPTFPTWFPAHLEIRMGAARNLWWRQLGKPRNHYEGSCFIWWSQIQVSGPSSIDECFNS